MIQFFLLVSRQGKCRLSKWYSTYSDKEKRKMVREVSQLCLNRPQKLCNFLGKMVVHVCRIARSNSTFLQPERVYVQSGASTSSYTNAMPASSS